MKEMLIMVVAIIVALALFYLAQHKEEIWNALYVAFGIKSPSSKMEDIGEGINRRQRMSNSVIITILICLTAIIITKRK